MRTLLFVPLLFAAFLASAPAHFEKRVENGTLFADSIRASSLNRLHQQAGQKTVPDQCHCVNLALATREPSTEDLAARPS